MTLGLSPKAIAAAIAGYLAPLIVGVLADRAGIDIEVGTTEAILLPIVTAVVTFVAAYLASPGEVAQNIGDPSDVLLDEAK